MSRRVLKDDEWACTDPKCATPNPDYKNMCGKCGKAKPRIKAPVGQIIGKNAAEKSKGLFAAEDWACSKCGNINWARRTTCNICNAPKFGELEARTGYGGGYMDRQEVEYIDRGDSDDEYDEFGRIKKKAKRGQPDGAEDENDGESRLEEKAPILPVPVEQPPPEKEKEPSQVLPEPVSAAAESSVERMPPPSQPLPEESKKEAEGEDDKEEEEEEEDEDFDESKYDLSAFDFPVLKKPVPSTNGNSSSEPTATGDAPPPPRTRSDSVSTELVVAVTVKAWDAKSDLHDGLLQLLVFVFGWFLLLLPAVDKHSRRPTQPDPTPVASASTERKLYSERCCRSSRSRSPRRRR